MSDPVPPRTVPTKADLYRTRAEECERIAAEASDPECKRLLLKAAQEWRFLHDQHETDSH